MNQSISSNKKRKFKMTTTKVFSQKQDQKRVLSMDMEQSKIDIEKKKKELKAILNHPINIFQSQYVKTLSEISKKANIHIDFNSCTKKELTNYSIYLEMCQILSNHYTAAKLRSIAIVAEAFPEKPRESNRTFKQLTHEKPI